MRIEKLAVKRLHGVYNYTITFNNDLTFIYGENGCGKTTILDILSSIVTGKLYNLFGYKFDEINLSYRKTKSAQLDTINIEAKDRKFEVSLNGAEMRETIYDLKGSNALFSRDEDALELDQGFMNSYEFARFLRRTFNYIYLPLSRDSQEGINIEDRFYSRHNRAVMFSGKDLVNKNYLNKSLRYVEGIVQSGCMRISSSENIINTKFRSNILTSSLQITGEYNIFDLIDYKPGNGSLSDIDRSKDEYIKTLKSIKEWNDKTDKRVDLFFAKYKEVFQELWQSKKGPNPEVTVDYLLMTRELSKIREIAAQAQEIEKEKELVRAPKTKFLKVVNELLSMGEERKIVSIDNEGKIIVEVEHQHRTLSLYNLSSGEKQIVIIFACLTFGLPTNQSGIYIVDEPEASLHLAWQKRFVDSIRQVNNSIQLIFATHAPEIIGRHINRAVKLIKQADISALKEDNMYDE